VQLADEIHRSGRQVTVAVGRHTRLPRQYRGHDIFWWMDRLGMLNQQADSVASLSAARRSPSLQLVGKPDHSTLDLTTLNQRGVRLVGRLLDIEGSRVRLADDLIATTSAADIKMAEMLMRINEFTREIGLAVPRPDAFEPTWTLASEGPASLDLKAEGIATVIWATGYRRAYPWLHVPVLDARGEIEHMEGATPAYGLYVLGLRFQRRRNSNFIDGVGADAWAIARQIAHSMRRVRVA
jgi:putative flavoprotein involved in K+ transport